MFVIGPDKKVKLVLVYPMTTGRNIEEVLRVIDSLQLNLLASGAATLDKAEAANAATDIDRQQSPFADPGYGTDSPVMAPWSSELGFPRTGDRPFDLSSAEFPPPSDRKIGMGLRERRKAR